MGVYFADTGISQFTSFGSSSKHAEVGPESFGLVVRRLGGTVPDIFGLVWPSFRPNSCSKSKISGRIVGYPGPTAHARAPGDPFYRPFARSDDKMLTSAF